MARFSAVEAQRITLSTEPIEARLIASLVWDAPEPVDDFWSNIQIGLARQCWPWVGRYTSSAGYGIIRYGDGDRFAHRESFRRCRGLIVDGLWVLHRCDNPPCCNPAHLFLGTCRDNVRDSMSKGRRRVALGSSPGQTSKMLREHRLVVGLCLTCGVPTGTKRCGECTAKKRAYDAARYRVKGSRG